MTSAPTARPTTRAPDAARAARPAAAWALQRAQLPLAGLLTAYLGFRAGGFFPGTTALAAVALAVLLLLRITLAGEPFAGWTRAAALAGLGGAGLASWILVSASWSGAPGSALVEFDRALLYLLVLVFYAAVPRRPADLAAVLRWTLLALVAVALAGLASRLAADVVQISPEYAADRLSFPITYWNVMGLTMAIGLVLALHAASGAEEPLPVRVAATASIPVLAVALYFTFSRGAIAVAVVGLVAYLVLARPRRFAFTLLAAGAPVAAGLLAAYGADALATDAYMTAPGPDQGHRVAAVLAGATLAAGVLRALLAPLERRFDRRRLPVPGRGARFAAAGGAMLVLAFAAVAFDAPGRIGEQIDAFGRDGFIPVTGDARDRLLQVGNNGRTQLWRVSRDTFAEEPWLGTGAGTFSSVWRERRATAFDARDGHSLYLELAGELGAVGLGLLAVLLGVPLVVAAMRLRGEQRHVHAAFLASALALLVHAGVDWDWEMPVVFAWFFAACGVVLARPANAGGRPVREPSRVARIVTGIACLLLAATPALVYASEAPLQRSREALRAGDCPTAIDTALTSIERLGVRPEPYEILGYCDLRAGATGLALGAMNAARVRDRDDWHYAYGVAVARAIAGKDPRPAAREGLRLNPQEPLMQDLARALDTGNPRRWYRAAATAPIPEE